MEADCNGSSPEHGTMSFISNLPSRSASNFSNLAPTTSRRKSSLPAAEAGSMRVRGTSSSPRRRGDEEVPLTLMLPASAAGREDLRLDVVGARLEKFEALRDGKFEMKDMVPCSGLEPLQSASMVASWPRRCAALRAVCLLNHLNTRSPRPRALGKIGKCSISQRAKVSLVGEHEKSKIDVMFGRIFV